MRLRARSGLFVISLLLAVVCQFAAAQVTQGAITGLVTDSTGAVVPGVKVAARNVATGVQAETVSSSTGNYVIPNLRVGTYEVNVSTAGFKSWSRSGIVLFGGDNIRVDVALEVGQVTERVTVTGAAPVLKTETTEVSATMERKLVEQLPVAISGVGGGMRNAFNIMMMLPQVKSNTGESAWDDLMVGGGQGFDWNVSVDGLSIEIGFRNHPGYMNRLTPPLDSVEELRIDTAAFKAEEAHASGGMITLITKSGTNEFHGSLFDFYQTQRLDANSWLNNKLGGKKAIYHRNDFGASAGGPVFIPKLYNGKNRSYFFFTYEGYRQPQTTGMGQLTVATAQMKRGDFSGWTKSDGTLIPIYDPTTTKSNPAGGFLRDPFPGNKIPANRLSPIALNLVKYMPDPNVPGALIRNLTTFNTAPMKRVENAVETKIDHNFGTKNRLALTFSKNGTWFDAAYDKDRNDWNNWGASLPYPLAGRRYTKVSEYYGQVYRLNDTHLITPTLINTFTLGYHRLTHPEHDVTAYSKGQNWGEKIGGPKNNPGYNNAMIAVSFATDNFYSWDPTKDYDEYHNIYGFDEDLAWVKGSHSLKFGYNFQIIKLNRRFANEMAGRATFHRLETARPTDNSGNSGSSFASFMLGTVDSGFFGTGYSQGMRYPSHAFYVQDDWKITPKLTANLGFRMEINPPLYDKYDQLSYFDPALANPAADGHPGAVRFLGFGPGRENKRNFYPTQKGYGPRAGLAYQFAKDTVIRAGFGMFYSNYKMMGGALGFFAQPTWSSADAGVTPAFYWDEGWPAWKPAPFLNPGFNAGFDYGLWYFIDDLARLPTSTTWNLAVSRTLPGNLVVDLTYTGTKGTHLASNRVNYMQIDPKYAYLGSTLNKRIDDPAVVALGFKPPFQSFTALLPRNATLGQSLRLFPQYTSVGGGSWQMYNGDSSYHALIIKVTKRLSHGLSLLASHTWSKQLTDADMALPGVSIGAGIGFGAAQNNLNRRLEKSYGALDIPHQFKLTTSYDFPFGKGKKYFHSGLGRWILGEWNLSVFAFAQSGYPLGVVDNSYANYLYAGPPRPNVTSLDWRAPTQGGSFDPDKDLMLATGGVQRRTNPAADPFGNAPRLNGATRSFPILRENTSLTRGITIKESLKMEFRWETYDLFNHKTWSLPPLDLSNSQFGKVTGAFGNRTMQLGLKLLW
ncbi:MAG: TonB-dependent receptor [Acidobacteriota bacterium]